MLLWSFGTSLRTKATSDKNIKVSLNIIFFFTAQKEDAYRNNDTVCQSA